jgi:hypothetical protein
MKRLLTALLCGACAFALTIGLTSAAASPSQAQVAKKCKKAKKGASFAKEKKCKRHKATPPPPGGGTTAPTGPTGPTGPPDTDGDGVPDSSDNCVATANVDQEDGDVDGKGDACDPCPLRSNPGTAGCPTTIYEISQGIWANGTSVHLGGVLVVALTPDGNTAWVQYKSSDPPYAGADHNGLKADISGISATVTEGQHIDIEGIVGAQGLTASAVTVDGVPTEPAQVSSATASDFTSGNAARNGVLVQVSNLTLASHNGEDWVTTEGITISPDILGVLPNCPNGHVFGVAIGIADKVGGQLQLLPVPGGVSCDHELSSLDLHGPNICAGNNGIGTVTLTTPAVTDTTVTLQSSNSAVLQVPPSVVVPNGMSSGNFQYTALAESTPVVTASASGIQVQDTINVLTGC